MPAKNIYLGVSKRGKRIMKPMTLYKKGRFMIDSNTKEIKLLSIAFPDQDRAMTMDHTAECVYSHLNSPFVRLGHEKISPSRFCRCGFYAYKDRIDAANHAHNSPNDAGDFLLTVVGSGKMIEYSKGYRYNQQRVVSIEAVNCIHYEGCTNKADRLVVDSWLAPTPICKVHSISIMRYPDSMGRCYLMTFAEMEASINAFAPAGLPHITVSSFCDDIVPWNGINDQPIQEPLFSIYA